MDRAKFNAALANKKKESKSISRTIFDMDLFAPKATQVREINKRKKSCGHLQSVFSQNMALTFSPPFQWNKNGRTTTVPVAPRS